jgi:hypothetical protein
MGVVLPGTIQKKEIGFLVDLCALRDSQVFPAVSPGQDFSFSPFGHGEKFL